MDESPPVRYKKIAWTGLGSNPLGVHTKKEFLNIVHKEYSDNIYWRLRGDQAIPDGKIKKNDINGWMNLVDAKWV